MTRLVAVPLALMALVPGAAWAAGPRMAECLAANEGAIQQRDANKLIEARAQSLVCSASSCPREVRDACQKRVAALAAEIPTLIFEAKDASGNDRSDVRVTMDGAPFSERLDGSAIAVDPGEHTFELSAPGLPAVSRHLVIAPGEVNRREVVPIVAPVALPAAAPLPVVAPAPPPSSSGLGTQRIAALAIGGAGVASVAVGAVTGLLASSAWSRVTSACGAGGPTSCAATDRSSVSSDESSAKTDGAVSTATFIAGGVLVATGLVLFLTGRHGESAKTAALTIDAGPERYGLRLSGSF